MTDKKIVEISTATILKVITIILALVFIYLIRDILLTLFLAVIVASAVDGPIDWLVRHKIKRVVAVAIIYVSGIALFGFLIYLIIPPLAGQIGNLASNLPAYIGQLQTKTQLSGAQFAFISVKDLLARLGSLLSNAAGDIFVATINFFGGIFSALIVLIISIYLAVREQAVKRFFVSVVSPEHEVYTADLIDRILDKLGAWFRGQIILMAAIGVMVYIALTILGVKFALTLALLAGLLEVVPIIGPILAAVPAVLFALLQSPALAIITLVVYYIIQELEKYLIVPQVMKRALGLNPITIMVAVLIGAELHGIIGAIIAIPVAAIISIGYQDLMDKRRSRNSLV